MKRRMPWLLVLALAAPLPAQVAGGGRTEQGVPVLQGAHLTLEHYEPRNLHARELLKGLRSAFGREFMVQDESGRRGPVTNLFDTGNLLCIYDEKDAVRRILAAARRLDEGNAPQQDSADEGVLTYRPAHVSAEALAAALRPFVSGGRGFRARTGPLLSVSTVHDAGMLLIRHLEPASRVEALLAKLDRPRPQVLIECWVIGTGAADEASQGLPDDLVRHLGRMLPGRSFVNHGTGLVRTVARSDQKATLEMDLTRGSPDTEAQAITCELMLHMEAYDEQGGGRLALRSIAFQVTRVRQDGRPERQQLNTSAAVAGGGYTVLGGLGGTPVYLVLRLRPGS